MLKRHRMMINIFMIFLIMMMINNDTYGDESDSLVFEYSIDSSFIYLDHLKRPNTKGDKPKSFENFNMDYSGQDWTLESSAFPRTMGLRYLKIGLDFKKIRSSSFHLTLRPDALIDRYPLSEDSSREFDSRSGESYRQMPSIKLLDSYLISLHRGDDLTFTYGVFESLLPKDRVIGRF